MASYNLFTDLISGEFIDIECVGMKKSEQLGNDRVEISSDQFINLFDYSHLQCLYEANMAGNWNDVERKKSFSSIHTQHKACIINHI